MSDAGLPGLTPGVRTLIIAIASVSIGALVADRLLGMAWLGAELALSWSGLVAGKVWQLVTYGLSHYDPASRFLEPLNFLFALLMLWMFGGEIESLLGRRRFWRFCVSTIVAAGLVGISVAAALGTPHALLYGSWPLQSAMIALWALTYPDRPIYFMFMLPIKGRHLLYVELAMLGLVLLNSGGAAVAPLAGLGAGVLWARGGWSPGLQWLRLRAWWSARKLKARRRPFDVVRGKDDFLH